MIKCENDGSSYGIQGALRVRSVVLFQASYHRGHPALMEWHAELSSPKKSLLYGMWRFRAIGMIWKPFYCTIELKIPQPAQASINRGVPCNLKGSTWLHLN